MCFYHGVIMLYLSGVYLFTKLEFTIFQFFGVWLYAAARCMTHLATFKLLWDKKAGYQQLMVCLAHVLTKMTRDHLRRI